MRRIAGIFMVIVLIGCVHRGTPSTPNEETVREYSTSANTLSDFSMTIVGYYGMQKLSVPKDFDAKQFFDVLEQEYRDHDRIKHIQVNYKVSVRPLEGGLYSVMLCDPITDVKIMEDISCHLDLVEIRSWENNISGKCVFESNWKPYCD